MNFCLLFTNVYDIGDYRKKKGRAENCKTNWKKQFYPVHGKVYKQQSVDNSIQNQFDINFESTFSLKESCEYCQNY